MGQQEQLQPEREHKHAGGRPPKYNQTMPAKAELYITKALSEGKLPKLAGLALFLGVARSTVCLWAEKYAEFSDSLEKINATQEEMLCDKGLNGEYNSTICKLILSSNHGYAERKDVTSGGEKLPPQIVTFADAVKPENPSEDKQNDNS